MRVFNKHRGWGGLQSEFNRVALDFILKSIEKDYKPGEYLSGLGLRLDRVF